MHAIAIILALLASPQEEKKKPDLKLAEAVRGDLLPTLKLEARFESAKPWEFKVAMDAYQGNLEILKVAPNGSLVRQGDALVELDRADLDRQLAAAEEDVRLARAVLEHAGTKQELEAKAEALALEKAETVLSQRGEDIKVFDEVSGPQMLLMSDLWVQYVLDYIDDQKEELDQLEKMYASEELTNETAEIVVQRARRTLERVKPYLKMAKEDSAVIREFRHPRARKDHAVSAEEARGTLDALRADQTLARVRRDVEQGRAKAAFETEERKLSRLRKDAEAFTTLSPVEGRVFYGPFKEGTWGSAAQLEETLAAGETLPAGQVVLTVCPTSLLVRANVPEANYFDVSPGQEVTVAPDARPDAALPGRVREKTVVAKGDGTFEAVVELGEPAQDLLPGMKADATVRLAERKDVLLVPSEAVSASGEKFHVKIARAEGDPESREVTVGKTDGKKTEIKSGLEPGEKVVLPE